MTYRFRPVAYHEIPDRYAAQTLAMAEALYGDDGEDYDETEDDPTDERYVSESDYYAASEQDWADLDMIRDWEAFGGFHNP